MGQTTTASLTTAWVRDKDVRRSIRTPNALKRVWGRYRLVEVGKRAGVRVIAIRPSAGEPTSVLAVIRLMVAAR